MTDLTTDTDHRDLFLAAYSGRSVRIKSDDAIGVIVGAERKLARSDLQIIVEFQTGTREMFRATEIELIEP